MGGHPLKATFKPSHSSSRFPFGGIKTVVPMMDIVHTIDTKRSIYSFKSIRHVVNNELYQIETLVSQGQGCKADILALSILGDKLRKQYQNYLACGDPILKEDYDDYEMNITARTLFPGVSSSIQWVLDNFDGFDEASSKCGTLEEIPSFRNRVDDRGYSSYAVSTVFERLRQYREDVLGTTAASSTTEWTDGLINCDGWDPERTFPSASMGFIQLQKSSPGNPARRRLVGTYRGRSHNQTIEIELPHNYEYVHFVNDYGFPFVGFDPQGNTVHWTTKTYKEFNRAGILPGVADWVKLDIDPEHRPARPGKFDGGFILADRTGIYHATRTSLSLEVVKWSLPKPGTASGWGSDVRAWKARHFYSFEKEDIKGVLSNFQVHNDILYWLQDGILVCSSGGMNEAIFDLGGRYSIKRTSISPRVLYNSPIKDYHITPDGALFVVSENSFVEYSPVPHPKVEEFKGAVDGFVDKHGDVTTTPFKNWVKTVWPKKMAKNMTWKSLDTGFDKIEEIASAGYPMHIVVFRCSENLKVFKTNDLIEVEPSDDVTKTPYEWERDLERKLERRKEYQGKFMVGFAVNNSKYL
ncbi:hypothetical protein TWF481_001388 [Arthrobotrys musiformis]|uniref:Uncharacterized protein n=1 Tax=Arthrobotrys musiformis TaxID=47236 RepID=A0AAV9WQF9_9PEZI